MYLLLTIFLYFQTGILTNDITSTLQINMPDAIVILSPLSYNWVNIEESIKCTGTVINSNHVLTAKHCRLSSNIEYVDDVYGKRYKILTYQDIPNTDITILKVEKSFKNITPLKFAYKNTNLESYIFGQCPYFFDTIPRIVKFKESLVINNFETGMSFYTDHWVSIDKKFMCGGDSGTSILQFQNNQFVIIGVFSMVKPDLLGQMFYENRGSDGYSFNTDFMLIE